MLYVYLPVCPRHSTTGMDTNSTCRTYEAYPKLLEILVSASNIIKRHTKTFTTTSHRNQTKICAWCILPCSFYQFVVAICCNCIPWCQLQLYTWPFVHSLPSLSIIFSSCTFFWIILGTGERKNCTDFSCITQSSRLCRRALARVRWHASGILADPNQRWAQNEEVWDVAHLGI